ncbi:MAG TPA: Gfo/Idh/MocA family oxidoreductase [bacterium]|mgnify:CR=1 FL=1|nr:Gfo/Idh/MocA family oxidoreductase [bacterium]HOL35463.1 Gfo/Idh/MocA family oxidoreductase [bacterium]HPP08861.1 Gfo/Idh/MocA family oxidoreductase [bacterium]
MSETKVAVVGGGYWGKNLIRVFHQLGGLSIICDTNPALRETYESSFKGVKFASRVEEVLNDDSISGVVIATPAATHYEIGRKFLEAGKDLFIEKPLALTKADGEKLVNISEKNNCILMVGHILHYHPAVIKLKQLIKNNELGDLQYLYSNRLNIGRIRHEENILWSFAPHDISLMLSLAGEMPDSVNAFGRSYLPHPVEDVTLTFFSFPSGITGHVFVCWLNPFKEQKFVVIGSKKMAVFDDTSRTDKLVLYHHKINWSGKEIPSIEKSDGVPIEIENYEPLLEETKHFLECMKRRTKPITDGQEGLRVLSVLEMAQNSLKKRGKL